MTPDWMARISPEQTVLIAGPTAAGKSALALELASSQGGVIVNADALQVFANWQVLTARPGRDELAVAPHALYGHVPGEASYSVGHWLRDVAPYLKAAQRPIIVGGTGLYFTALTRGLADIPPTPPDIRALADSRRAEEGLAPLLAELDPATRARIDTQNPMRVQRAWEVLHATGRGLADWQSETGPPILGAGHAALLLEAHRDWLGDRIARRFDRMIANGALEEARRNLNDWNPARPSSRAIGAPDLIAHLRGECTLEAAIRAGKIATRQYAKRQRTWFRSKMRDWVRLEMP